MGGIPLIFHLYMQAQKWKGKCSCGYDGDHSSKPSEALPNGPMQVKESTIIKEVPAIVRNILDNLDSGLGYSSGKWADFVCLVELNPEGGNFLHA